MKKKKLLLMVCTLLLVGLAAGCGAKKQGNKKGGGPVLCERLKGWDTLYQEGNGYYLTIQIEDLLLHPGMLGKDVERVVSAGKANVTTKQSMDKLIESDEVLGEAETVIYYRNNTPWFTIYMCNYTDELLPIGDCKVTAIVPSKEALPYCRFFDGNHTMDSLTKLKETDFESFKSSLEAVGYIVKDKSYEWIVYMSANKYCPFSVSKEVPYQTYHNVDVELTIDLDTGDVSGLNYSEALSGRCIYYESPFAEE